MTHERSAPELRKPELRKPGLGRPGLGLPALGLPALGQPMTQPAERWDADEALEQLYAAHWRGLVRLGVLLLGDQGSAEEVVQDSFVAVHAKWSRLRDPDLALAYLRRTVVNRSRSALRHRTVVARHLASQPTGRDAEPTQPGVDQCVLAGERRAAVLEALGELPGRQREVLVLRYFLDLSEAEIAETLGISRGAVKSHASRAAAALRGRLTEHSPRSLDSREEDPS